MPTVAGWKVLELHFLASSLQGRREVTRCLTKYLLVAPTIIPPCSSASAPSSISHSGEVSSVVSISLPCP